MTGRRRILALVVGALALLLVILLTADEEAGSANSLARGDQAPAGDTMRNASVDPLPPLEEAVTPRAPAEIEEKPAAPEPKLHDGPVTVVVRVEDHDGRPLGNVGVDLGQAGGFGTLKNRRRDATDRNGLARFPGVPLGLFLTEIDASTLPESHLPAPRGSGQALHAGEFLITLVCPAGTTIAGTMVDRNGSPLVGVRARFVPQEAGVRNEHASPDEHGRFRLENVRPGEWTVSVQVRDPRALSGQSLPPPVSIMARFGQVAHMELRCMEEGEWIRGRVTTAGGAPVPGLLVRAGMPLVYEDKLTPHVRGHGSAFAVTEADGSYRLGPLAHQRYAVSIGDRRKASKETRDAVKLASWPENFLATPGDDVIHSTTVELTE